MTSDGLVADVADSSATGLVINNTAGESVQMYYNGAGVDADFTINRTGSGAADIIIKDSGDVLFGAGNVLVGTTGDVFNSSTASGVVSYGVGSITAARANSASAIFNRTGSDGDIAEFRSSGTVAGSIGTKASDLTIGTGDTGLRFVDSTNTLYPWNTTTNSGTDGTIDLGEGSSNRFKDLYLSGGVYLGGTGAANKLDDYEEGTFTPTLYGVSTYGPPTYAVQLGYYTKVGNVVNCTIRLVTSSLGTVNGQLRIGSLPFTSGSSSENRSAISWGYGAGMNLTAGEAPSGWVEFNSTYIRLTKWSGVAGTSYLDDAEWSSDGSAMISLTYLSA